MAYNLFIRNLGEQGQEAKGVLEPFPTKGERSFPKRKWYGFMIGAASRHAQVDLVLPGGFVAPLSVGCPFIGEVEGVVEVQKRRPLWSEDIAHIVGLTCPEEIAGAHARRGQYHKFTKVTGLPATATITVPAAGRRHIRFLCEASAPGINYGVQGRYGVVDPAGSGVVTAKAIPLVGDGFAATATFTSGTPIGLNFGEPATRPEYFDYVDLFLASIGASEVVYVVAEAWDE